MSCFNEEPIRLVGTGQRAPAVPKGDVALGSWPSCQKAGL